MRLTTCVLASGSSGNCIYVASDETRILIDAGLSCREAGRRLNEAGVELESIHAVCVSHEHSDHVSGLAVLQRRTLVPVYANAGTIEGVERGGRAEGIDWRVFTTGHAFTIGDLEITPFSVPHDSYDPVGFVISCGSKTIGLATDMGMPTTLVRERLKGCGALVLESNHDVEMLKASSRPWSLKQRIAGRQGHLSNMKSGELVAEIAGSGLQVVFLAHMSADCNSSEVAANAMARALQDAGHDHVEVKLTYPDRISEIVTL